MDYLTLKMIHIMAATVLMGTGVGIAFFMLMAYLSKDLTTLQITTKHVVLADWIFTTPAIITQFLTGLLLMKKLAYHFSSTWFMLVISLFIFIGLCWLPVVWIQYKLKYYAALSFKNKQLAPQLHYWIRRWVALGIPAFTAIIAIFYLMVFKPYILH